MQTEEIKKKLKKLLGRERYSHCLRVEKTALKLASLYGLPFDIVSTAALLHDCSRFLNNKGFIAAAKKHKIKIPASQLVEPKLLHAPIAAKIAKSEFGISNPQILKAIEKHTLGSQKMSLLDKIIYIADHIEPARQYPGVRKVRKLAFKDKKINAAVLESMNCMIKHLLDNSLSIVEITILNRNYFLKMVDK